MNQELPIHTNTEGNEVSAPQVTPEQRMPSSQGSPRVFRHNHSNSRPRNNRPPRSMVGPKFDTTVTGKRETDHIPPLKDGDIRIIHFGGVEEIGRNMSMVEYKDSIIIIDCGVQFTETSTPGIDFILPNTRYLEEHKHKIKGV